jgi:hypothetical protein
VDTRGRDCPSRAASAGTAYPSTLGDDNVDMRAAYHCDCMGRPLAAGGRQVRSYLPWDRVDTHPDRTSLYPPCSDVGPALYDKCPLGAILSPVFILQSPYFSHLQTGVFTNEAGSSGDALHRPAIAVHDNFPEKGTSVGENKICNALKTRDLLSISFSKKLLLGRVGYSSCALAIAFLP